MTRLALALLAAIVLVSSGCTALRWPFSRADGLASGLTLDELGSELAAYAARFGSTVHDASTAISEQSELRSMRRVALVWRLQMPPLIEQVAFEPSPRLGFVACVMLAKAQHRYLTEGDGRALFGEHQSIAVDAAQVLVDDVFSIGERFLTKSQLAEVDARTTAFAAEYPIRGREFSVQAIPRTVVRQELAESFGWLFALPLAPFRALQGVDTGAAAIRDFNRTAAEFAQIAKQMPERLRGQLELFAYDLEDRETVERSVDALDRAATSAERAATSVERLPDDMRRLLGESQGSVEAAGKVVAQLESLAGPLAETASQLEQASAHWLAVLGPKDTGPRDPNDRPFDVLEWQATATSIGQAASELRGLATELETLTGSAGLDAAIDRIFWRAVALVGVFFALLLVYRVLTARLASRVA